MNVPVAATLVSQLFVVLIVQVVNATSTELRDVHLVNMF